MAGIFGAVGLDRERRARLTEQHRQRWPGCEVVTTERVLLGGRSPGGARAVRRTERNCVAVDGELAAYRRPSETETSTGLPFDAEVLDDRGVPRLAASVAVWNGTAGTMRLAANWSGAFPLHWRHQGGAFVFSSLSGVLASVFDVEVDPVGLVSFVKDAHYVGSRTCFREFRRVQAGQVVRFDSGSGEVSVEETSRAWVGPAATVDDEETVEAMWSGLLSAVDRGLEGELAPGLMLSGGWDSRTLMAAAQKCRESKDFVGLSHGATGSRELRIVERLCGEARWRCLLRPVGPEEFAPDYLRSTHQHCGTAQFPYWRASATTLSGLGAGCVAAGVFGEVLGGHYGPGMSLSGWSKIRWVLSHLVPMPGGDASAGRPRHGVTALRDLLLRGLDAVERFFRPGFWNEHDLPAAVTGDVEAELGRLERRGVEDVGRLTEAYLCEHRGGQYINAQLRSARVELPIAVPFAHRELLGPASRIPFERKVHNRLNQHVLRRKASSLLDHPLAAVLVPASAPLLVQEASRAIRKAWEEGQWWLHDRTGGRTGPPALSWIDFGFMEQGNHLTRIADDFRWDGWDSETVGGLARAVESGSWRGSLHEPVFQLLKLYTLDLHLRRA